MATIRERGFRIVVDYGYSGGSFVLPLVFGALGVEAVTAHAFESDAGSAPSRFGATLDYAQRLVEAVNADFGAVFDRSAERLFLIDETGREVRPDQALLLYLHLLTLSSTGKYRRPDHRDEPGRGGGRRQARGDSHPGDARGPDAGGGRGRRRLRRRAGGGYVFPGFLPAYDASASLCKLLELLAPVDQPLSKLVAALPRPTLIHRQLQCPWALKGTVMRVLNERFADANVDLRDGIKIFDERGWVQVLPDADEPLVHLYAEGESAEDSEDLETELRTLVTDVIEREEIGSRS